MSLGGCLSEFRPCEILKLLGCGAKSGVLEICTDDNVAWLRVRDGLLVEIAVADSSRAPGNDANVMAAEVARSFLDEVLAWDHGEFSFQLGDIASGYRGITLAAPIRLEDLAGEPAESPRIPAPAPVAPAVSNPAQPAPPASYGLTHPAIILLDPELELLEHTKAGLEGQVPRIHLFQDAKHGLERLKQYLMNGEFPALVLSQQILDSSRFEGSQGWQQVVSRVRSLSPRLCVVILGGAPCEAVQAVIERPEVNGATAETWRSFVAQLVKAL